MRQERAVAWQGFKLATKAGITAYNWPAQQLSSLRPKIQNKLSNYAWYLNQWLHLTPLSPASNILQYFQPEKIKIELRLL